MTSALTTPLRRLRRATNGRPATTAALVVAIIVILVATPQAQQMVPTYMAVPNPAAIAGNTPTDVDLLVGRSTVLDVGGPIARVSLTVPDIADALVTAPNQLLIHGKQPGTISLFVWDRAGAIKTYEVKVRRDLTPLIAHIKQLFPGEAITVMGSGKDVVLSGTVSGQYVIDKAASVAGGYVEKKENVVNLLRQQEGVASNQVMLRVRFAEVSRSAVMELGANLFTGPTGYKDWIARTTTQQFSAPDFTELSRTGDLDGNLTGAAGKYSLSDFLNIFIFNNKYNIGTVIRALQEKGLFESLAEPNLIATNGKEASFLAGGEYPYPVVQGGNSNNSVTIMFKEFGIRLNFTPTVLGGDLINLKVKPEVSSLDFANAVTVSGFRVPSLSTRRTETEVELRDGQTFAIAGLLNNTVQDSMRKIPGIGDVPILGWLFKSRALHKAQTELVVMITPTIVRRDSTGVSQGLPSLVEPFMGPPSKTRPVPDAYVGSPRYPANQPARPGSDAANAPAVPAAAPAVTPAVTPAAPARPVNADQPAREVIGAAPPAGSSSPNPSPAQQPVAAPLPSHPLSDTPQEAPSAPLTKAQLKAIERAREEERKAYQAQLKKDAEAKKAEDKRRAEEARKTEELRKQVEKLEQERQQREATEQEQQKRQKSLDEAAARLKEAQDAYQLELSKSTTKTASR